jgi:hypothetical protein
VVSLRRSVLKSIGNEKQEVFGSGKGLPSSNPENLVSWRNGLRITDVRKYLDTSVHSL